MKIFSYLVDFGNASDLDVAGHWASTTDASSVVGAFVRLLRRLLVLKMIDLLRLFIGLLRVMQFLLAVNELLVL